MAALQGPSVGFLMLAFMLFSFSWWWSTRVFGCRNAATCTPFDVKKHLGWQPGNIHLLYYVNKINRSYGIVFIAYTKKKMEKMWSYFFGCFIFTLFIWIMHFNCWEKYCFWSIKYYSIYSSLLCCNITKLI